MENLNNIIAKDFESNDLSVQYNNYEFILDEYGLIYRKSGHYLVIGSDISDREKIIYISVIQSEIQDLFKILIPYLSTEGLTFKIIKDKTSAKLLLHGLLGYHNIGKLIVIGFSKELDFSSKVQKLMFITKGFRGPEIPGLLNIGGVLYCDYDHGEGFSTKKTQILLNNYLVLSSLKLDAKGNVFKCFYIKGFSDFGLCVIKEGRKLMWSDDEGRDIKDRLEWQRKIHNDLADSVFIPKIIDMFEEHGNSYLVMEFIKGKTLTNVIAQIYQGKSWLQLAVNNRLNLLKLLLNVVNILKNIHDKKYIHRDLTPNNFILTASNRLYVIDLELAYRKDIKYPTPPFQLGSTGYMSPEQMKAEMPTEKEDVYTLGALMIVFFTNIHPVKFDFDNLDNLKKSILFFTGDNKLSDIIIKCLNPQPCGRPELEEIKSIVSITIDNQYKVQQKQLSHSAYSLDNTKVNAILLSSIEGLTISALVNNRIRFNNIDDFDIWFQTIYSNEIEQGILSPLAGFIFTVFLAKKNSSSAEVIDVFTEYLKKTLKSFLIKKENNLPGLFDGLAGKAILYQCAILTGLMPDSVESINDIHDCFGDISANLGITNGVSGQASSALVIYNYHPTSVLKDKLIKYVEVLNKSQLENGSWPVYYTIGGKQNIATGLDNGVSGILIFLLKYNELFPTDRVGVVIEKGLAWLQDSISRKSLRLFKNQKNGEEDHSLSSGLAGIALVFLYAYEYRKERKFESIAEKILNRLINYPVNEDFSLSTGLSGIGIVYMEASRICKSEIWRQRAIWIYNVLENLLQLKNTNKVTWNTNGFSEKSLGWFNGVTGIIIFILCIQKNILSHNKDI